jgi:Ran GTPase-activating protein (RanGAP) involved in mRNA processing and transport
MASNQVPVVSFLEVGGKVLSGEEFEEYCKDHGLCKRCAKVKTHRRVLKLFGKGSKFEPLTLHDEETGEYSVYKGYCLQPTCYTLGQAKRLLGEGGRGSDGAAGRRSGRRSRGGLSRVSNRGRRRRSASSDDDDDASVGSTMSAMSAMSSASMASVKSMTSFIGNLAKGTSKRFKGPKRNLSIHSSGSSVASDFSSDEFSLDGSDDGFAMTEEPEEGDINPIVQHRIEQLVQFDYFVVLDLSKVELRPEDVDAIAGAIEKTQTLETLILDKCKIKDEAFAKIMAALVNSGFPELKKLSARQNKLGHKSAAALAPILEKSTTLTELDIHENSLGSKGAGALLTALAKNPKPALHTLHMAQNEIWDLDDGTFLRKNRSLKIFNLDGNYLHDEGVDTLALAIADNPRSKIEQLFLGWNGVGDDGAIALGRMIEKNRTLQVLGLTENEITNVGARALLSSLPENYTVKEIQGLYHNHIERKFIIVAIKRLLHRAGERAVEEEAGTKQADEDNEEAKLPEGDDVSVASGGSLKFDAQIQNEEEPANFYPPPSPTTQTQVKETVALEVIETWDWGTFGMDASEPKKEELDNLKMPDIDDDNEEAAPPTSLEDPGLGSFGEDRLTVFQSAPLAYFDRKTTEHHAVPLLDFEYEATEIKESLKDSKALGGKVNLEFETATSDRLKSYFSAGASSVLHFSCYGQENCVTLENGFGYMTPLSQDDLKSYVSSVAGKLQLVVVSAYHATDIAKAFLDAGVKHVVCLKQEGVYRDEGTVTFTKGLYEALAQNKPLKEAFNVALDTVRRSSKAVTHDLLERYTLLPDEPKDETYHSINVFYQSPIQKRPGFIKGDTSMLPALPDNFVGREVDMYEILESLRVDDVVRVGGLPGSGKATVVCAVSHYILNRPKSFLISNVFWLPAAKGIVPDEDTLYGDLCLCAAAMIESTEDIWETDEFSEARERILIELEDQRNVLVIDGRLFESEAAGENLEQFCSHLLNEAKIKIILLTSNEGDSVAHSKTEETIIDIGPLDLRSSAILFGSTSPHISSQGCPAARTPEEFASYMVPPSVSKLSEDSTHSSRRMEELYMRMGGGNPADIMSTASSISFEDFNELLRFAQRPEVRVDSAGALQGEIINRTESMNKAVKHKNYARARDYAETIEELESLKKKFPSLSDLVGQERKMKREINAFLAQRKYDDVTVMKRKLLALKKIINKEKDAQPDQGSKYTATGKLAELQAQMDNMLKMAESMGKSLSAVDNSWMDDVDNVTLSIGQDNGACILKIYHGDAVNYQVGEGLSALLCWTNEACDLSTYEKGEEILRLGGEVLVDDIEALPRINETIYGPVKSLAGEAAFLGPKKYGELAPQCLVLSASPLSPTNDDNDWDGDKNDPDSRHFMEIALRASYRSSFAAMTKNSVKSVGVQMITTKETGTTYETTLQIGLRTIVEESKFSSLRSIDLCASSSKEATTLINMAMKMGLEVVTP